MREVCSPVIQLVTRSVLAYGKCAFRVYNEYTTCVLREYSSCSAMSSFPCVQFFQFDATGARWFVGTTERASIDMTTVQLPPRSEHRRQFAPQPKPEHRSPFGDRGPRSDRQRSLTYDFQDCALHILECMECGSTMLERIERGIGTCRVQFEHVGTCTVMRIITLWKDPDVAPVRSQLR